jgi:hypothetical protein
MKTSISVKVKNKLSNIVRLFTGDKFSKTVEFKHLHKEHVVPLETLLEPPTKITPSNMIKISLNEEELSEKFVRGSGSILLSTHCLSYVMICIVYRPWRTKDQ